MSTPSITRPGARGAAATTQDEARHVTNARKALTEADEKKIPLLAPAHYHKGLQEVKALTDTPVKHLLLEAIDDLFEKYKRGDGRYEVDDVAELKRRLQALQ
ncbi:hypothetical protein [Pseudomonas aeruginosa]|uniref:hypothetical protein n=1 Tax=Pseudomonas aeruginosa TaxID=287 RepID=UPI001CD72F8A|nr:hypothetical protein [Pseudomonas aeruginosa]